MGGGAVSRKIKKKSYRLLQYEGLTSNRERRKEPILMMFTWVYSDK